MVELRDVTSSSGNFISIYATTKVARKSLESLCEKEAESIPTSLAKRIIFHHSQKLSKDECFCSGFISIDDWAFLSNEMSLLSFDQDEVDNRDYHNPIVDLRGCTEDRRFGNTRHVDSHKNIFSTSGWRVVVSIFWIENKHSIAIPFWKLDRRLDWFSECISNLEGAPSSRMWNTRCTMTK